VPLDPFDLRNAAILLDVDGTILDIAPTPYEVYVSDTLRQTLVRLAERSGGALALVSGRRIDDLDAIFAPLRLPAIGGHGAEIRPAANGKPREQRAAPLDPELKQRLKTAAAQRPGVVVEDKGYSLALHYRLVLEQGLEVVDEVYRICKAYPSGSFDIIPGKAVIEVKSVGFDKGTAVRELMTYPPFAGRMPIFVGDDTTDEAAFAVMPAFHGIAISVGRKVPGVIRRLEGPDDVRQWLERISEKNLVVPS
jgi:trehalose 6-phosphate phosphatase